ncbi:MAG: FAD-binding oxidoreductase [Solirubrobacteraceae bacterium]
MAATATHSETPATAQEAAELLAAGGRVRIRGGGTRAGWGHVTQPPDLVLSTAGLNRIVEHNEGDLTAVVEAGVPLREAQQRFAAAGQMLALDPPGAPEATVGGVFATGDSGPLRHRYGAARDLIVGITVALPDGTVAKAGGKVIKNVAGYDLAKLFTGAFGTLGLIVQVSLRLHPRPPQALTARGVSDDPEQLAAAAGALAHKPLEAESLDVAWRDGRGAVLVRFGGATAQRGADAAAAALREHGCEADVVEDDAALWQQQRAHQRSQSQTVVKVSALPVDLAKVLRAAGELDGTVVGRAGLGLSWVTLPGGADAVRALRAALAPAACVVTDAPQAVREAVDPWDAQRAEPQALLRRVKERFDSAGVCNPGLYVGGI